MKHKKEENKLKEGLTHTLYLHTLYKRFDKS